MWPGGWLRCGTGANSYVEMYSYTSYGAMTKKKLRLTRMLRITGGLIPSYGARIADLETTAGYDAEGRLETVQYPAGGPLYKYSFDLMGMPSKLRDETNAVDVVSGVTYGLAGEMLTFGGSESRSYNVNGQMTALNLPGRTINYNFPAAGANNGKVASIVDSGETIAYQYDSLQRLISATGSSGWSQSYTFDGFGNLTAKTGTGGAPSFSATIDAATNRWVGVSHDANGNQLYAPMMAGMPNAFTLGYDVSNRMTLAWNGGKKNEYEYDPGNKRVTEVNYTANGSGDWVKDGEVLHFFGITGQRLATYSVGVMNEGYSTAAVILTQSASWVWFGGKLANGNQDRLGSVGKYLPYGEEKPGATGNPANGTVKFATYVRDAVTGIDYADQRWHAPGAGRFLTADPYQASAGAADPGSWNRYGYVGGDPIGRTDYTGLQDEGAPRKIWCIWLDREVEPGACPSAASVQWPSQPTAQTTYRYYVQQTLERMRGLAQNLNLKVGKGQINDCEALAAWMEAIPSGLESADYLAVVNLLIPSNLGGGGIVFGNGGPSGYLPQFQDGVNPASDQSHHFAFAFAFGISLAGDGILGNPNSLSAQLEVFLFAWATELIQRTPDNTGDVNLAIAAGSQGYSFGRKMNSGKYDPGALGNWIRQTLCQPTVRQDRNSGQRGGD